MAKKASEKDTKGSSIREFSIMDDLLLGKYPSAGKLRKQQLSYRTYSTGCLMLDLAIGRKDPITGLPGIPERAIVEIFGRNQSLKSATAEQLMKNVLDADPNNIVVYIASEEPDTDRFESLGLDQDRMMVLYHYDDEDLKDKMAEQNLKTAKRAVLDHNVKMVVLDSIRALIPAGELFTEKGIIGLDEKHPLFQRANLLYRFVCEFDRLSKRAILFMTNHLPDSIQADPRSLIQNPRFTPHTPGGRGKEFMATIRIHSQTSPIETEAHDLSGKPMLKGWEVSYRLVKNKYRQKSIGRVATSQFYFDPPGFRRESDVANCALYLGIINNSGAWFYYKDEKIQGRDNLIEYLKEHPEIRENIEKEIVDRAEEVYQV